MRQFIRKNFYVSEATVLTDDTSLITSGLVDSTGMLEVIAFLEEEYGIRIAEEELVPENLETIRQISAFITRKKRPAA